MKLTLLFVCGLFCASAFGQSYTNDFTGAHATRYFDFRYKAGVKQIEELGRFADAFIDLVNRDFFKAKFDYPIRVLVLEDKARFQKFVKEKMDVRHPPNFGIYFPRDKTFVSYEGAGLGTFAHEIMHPLVDVNLKDAPIWAIEGIPTLFEKFYGYWKEDEIVLEFGFHNPWRIEMLGPNLTKLDLKKLLTTRNSLGQFYECDIRMLSMFLWKEDKFKTFLQLLQRRDKKGFKTYFEAAFGMPVEQIEPRWKKYLEETAEARPQIMRLPGSFVMANQKAFETFAQRHGIPVRKAERD